MADVGEAGAELGQRLARIGRQTCASRAETNAQGVNLLGGNAQAQVSKPVVGRQRRLGVATALLLDRPQLVHKFLLNAHIATAHATKRQARPVDAFDAGAQLDDLAGVDQLEECMQFLGAYTAVGGQHGVDKIGRRLGKPAGRRLKAALVGGLVVRIGERVARGCQRRNAAVSELKCHADGERRIDDGHERVCAHAAAHRA